MLASLLTLLLSTAITAGQETGVNPGWPRWCGKVYEAAYPNFNPGGQTVEPPVAPGAPLLNLQFKTRYSLYLDSEKEAHFVVKAALSPYHGAALPDMVETNAKLDFEIRITGAGTSLLKGSVPINSTENLLKFDLSPVKSSLDPYNLTLSASIKGHTNAYTATSELLYLPEKTKGSVTKLDNLYGGMLFRNSKTNGKFDKLLAYGYYSSYDGFLGSHNTADIQKYADWGLNALTPLTQYPVSTDSFAYMDQINLLYQYDLRENYRNLTWVEENIRAVRDNEGLFSIWSADEPDGHQDPFNATVLTYNLIRRLDPYHPVAVVLNCQDFYFRAYTEGGCDIIMEDAYPIGINSTFSKWGTACNATHGDCGCDNCAGGAHAVQDVRDRLDVLARYEGWEGLWPKMKVHNPQSFHGEGYWARDPTPAEEFAMNLVALNHGAQSIISWVYPAADVLSEAHGRLARVLTKSPVVDFVVANDRPHAVGVAASKDIDVAYWVREKEMLVSVVNGGYENVTAAVEVELPGVASIVSVPWGNVTWTLKGSKLSTPGFEPLGTSLVILKLT